MKRQTIVALLLTFAAGLTACGNVPVIRRINPGHAPAGAVIEIVGENFGAEQGTGFVTLGTVAVAPDQVLTWEASSIKMRVPATAPTGKMTIQITTDGALSSNKKAFTVDEPGSATGHAIMVANRSIPSLEVYNAAPNAALSFSIDLNASGANTVLRGLASSAAQQKIFASVVRSNAAGEETGALIAFGGAAGGITKPTVIDVGVQPTGLAVSPSGNRLYVAATASGMLTVVNAVDNSVIADLNLDLGALSYGFEPLYVTAFASPDTTDAETSDWVAVAGNNWFLGRTEVITYAPNTTQPIVSVTAVDGLTLQAPIAVSGATAQAWVAGEQAGKAAVAALDLAHGNVVDLAAFGAGLTLSGFSGDATTASDVAADPAGAKVYVALPGAGVASLTMTADGLLPEEATLIAVDGPYRLLPLPGADGAPAQLLVTRPAAGAVARVSAEGEVSGEYLKTAPEPTEIAEFPLVAQ